MSGDWNGHMWSNNLACERVQGGYGAGSTKNKGERLIDFTIASNMALLNTLYCKRDDITFTSGGQETQIDYILYRRGRMNEVTNCKVIKGGLVARQHCLAVGEINIKKVRKRKTRSASKIMRWKMRDDDMSDTFR